MFDSSAKWFWVQTRMSAVFLEPAALPLIMNDVENKSLNSQILQVTNVRNQIMHSANFAVTAEDFQVYMGRIRALGEALGEKVPEFQSFSKDMAEVGATGALWCVRIPIRN